ncbi:Serine/threonine-protein kinase AfsK [Actinomadura rubteroloni]|uniref:Serine/threonine-protein kinase AfsK n=1 Tax=Actinomadura rubteroloni TaxID=1926885 RepID=A0A2P4UHW7_9ACTN|nr:serine/threonine-protein kinase [Actinomadura rubteroloni]POM24654.1 Serine/threonine-protein kinase AfsK [Actinomadura rubteroloni]
MAVAPLDPGDPDEIGGYRLAGRLGEGGQGVVYLATGSDGERVAVKVLKTADRAARARFAREMAAARRVAPFCTAAVLDASADGPLPYLVSEFVDGPSLADRVAARGPLDGDDLHRLAVAAAGALAAIHAAGIVHRDLKPANVLLGPDGPRVVDFGIARAIDADTSTGLVGTPAYFAPEWLDGAAPTAASDVFAWAGTMVFAATGRPPFGRAASIPAVLHRIAHGEPDLDGVPAPLRAVLADCLDKDPARRPDARRLMTRLVDPAETTHVADPVPPRRARPLRWTVACALLAGAGWGAVSAWPDGGGGKPHRERPAAAVSSTTYSSSSTTVTTSGDPIEPVASATAAFAGTWTGTLRRGEGFGEPASTTEVTLTLRAGSGRGTIAYRAWGCTNTLAVLSVSGDALYAQESPPGGRTNRASCAGGTVTLTRTGAGLAYSGRTLVAISGTLRR